MRLVIQRVKHASVEIDGAIHGKINQGYMILVGIQNEDTREIVEKMGDYNLMLLVTNSPFPYGR